MPLSPGSRLGHYDVTALIGEGGMGQVYRATDTKLKREVAIKVLPSALAADPDRLARFQREAQVLASLNHPNIAAIHGLEESDGQKALVMELVEGPTLADRIAEGPIPVDDTLPIAKQIAEALEAAHEQGIIHRDLKPANIKVREDGTVKVLDFGLAKLADSGSQDPRDNSEGLRHSQSPTLTTPAMTQAGMILGTAAYMAPEQAKGRSVDGRADVWAFGVVLFEMLSGRRAFDGEDTTDVLGAVVRLEPDWEVLPSPVPPRIRQVIRGGLQKNVKSRIAHMQDVRLAMEGTFETTASASSDAVAAPQLQLWQRPTPALAAALALLVVGIVAGWALMRPDVVPADLVRFTIVPPDTAPLAFGGTVQDLAISPDGTQVVYRSFTPSGASQLNLRPLDQLVGAPLRGTEGGASPFVSPDGEWVGFVEGAGNTVLQKVSIFGGPPVTVTESPNRHGRARRDRGSVPGVGRRR
jgi:serine/threonine-protein kinase